MILPVLYVFFGGLGIVIVADHVRGFEVEHAKRRVEPNETYLWPGTVVLPISAFLFRFGWSLSALSMVGLVLLAVGFPDEAEIFLVVGVSLLALVYTCYGFMQKRRHEIQAIREGRWVVKKPLDTWLPKQ